MLDFYREDSHFNVSYAGLDRSCNEYQLLCLGNQGHIHLDGTTEIAPQTGNHFEIHAAPWDYLDSLNLIQNSVTVTCPIQQALEEDSPRASNETVTHRHPQTARYSTQVPPLGTQSSFTQELHELWHQGAFAWGEEERSARVVTYYVNHEDLFPRCDAGRPVHLWANYANWEDTMRRAWSDRIRHAQPLDYFVVTPMPPNLEHGIVAYVLLVQNRRDLVTSLVSVFGINGRLQGRSAVTTFEQVQDVHLIQALGLHQQCLVPNPMLLYEVSFQDQRLPAGRPILARNGHSFVASLQINHRMPVARGRNMFQHSTKPLRSRVEDRSTTEEPLLSTVSSPVLCALPPSLGPGLASSDDQCQGNPMDYAEEHSREEHWNLQASQEQQPPGERTPLPTWLPPWWADLLRQFQEEGVTECLEEGPILYVLTWFLHGQQHRQCMAPRVLRLDRHWHRWWEDLKELWGDSLDATLPAEVGLVRPTPPMAPTRYHSAHLILHQATMAESVCVVTQLFHGHLRAAFGQFARVAPPLLDTIRFLQQSFPQRLCESEGRGCVIQLRDRFLQPGDPPVFLPDYTSLVVHVDHPAFGPSFVPNVLRQGAVGDEADEGSILQMHCERLTDRSVAHTCRPQVQGVPTQISLEESLPVLDYAIGSDCGDAEDRSTKIAYLKPGHDGLSLPPHVEICLPGTAAQVEVELVSWGHTCRAIQFGGHDQFVCFSIDWNPSGQELHYVYGSEQGHDADLAFLHTSTNGPLTVKDHMSLLHKRGCMKAAITADVVVWKTIHQVIYVCNQPTLAPPMRERAMTPWPPRQPQNDAKGKPFQSHRIQETCSSCLLTLGCTVEELDALFHCGIDTLCTDLASLDIPDTTAKALERCTTVDRIDRLVIFTDGSSIGGLRHQPPMLTDEQGYPDSWAYVVLAEQYLDEGSSALQFLGWQAQPVRYEQDSAAFLGTSHTGSDAAEREAMFWASFWRLTNNTYVPTVFCSDSSVTCLQATGKMGTNAYDETFRCLRGTQQALEAFMPAGTLQVRHVHGHASDPWNDLADYLAKHVRTKGYYLPRQPVSMHKWKPLIPFLWMMFSENSGLPQLTLQGFDVTAPALPQIAEVSTETVQSFKFCTIDFTLSLATANVQSLLSTAAHGAGHAGKVQYLREQFKAHGLQILGIQEARTPQSCGTQDQVLRISSGHHRGQYGVELWVDLERPYAHVDGRPVYFDKQHFVVLHAEPQILIVRAHTKYFEAGFVVAHAPHSGHARADREAWWQHISDRLASCNIATKEHLYVLIDANATAGSSDSCHVGPRGDEPSSSTQYFRDFLHQHALGLPATFQIHEGPAETWTTPDGQHKLRIDHVAVPIQQCEQCVFSEVLETFDLCNVLEDHSPVGLQLAWRIHTKVPQTQLRRARHFERNAISKGCMTKSLQCYQVPEWSCDIEQHVSHYNDCLLQTLTETCPKRRCGPKKSYITGEIWSFRDKKLACKAKLKDLRVQARRHVLHACLRAWRQHEDAHDDACEHFKYHTTLLCGSLRTTVELRALAVCLKRQLAKARVVFLQKHLADLPPEVTAGQIMQLMKQIAGPTNPKKQISAVFPAVKQEDGTPCLTPAQAADRWIQFFSDMEGGARCTDRQLRASWQRHLAQFQQENLSLCLHDLPSLCDLERAFARVAAGKAIGQDGLPPEMCRTHPAELARMSYSQLLKLALHGQEALHHKGGSLVQAWKGKGARDICASYRSLLVSSHQGKAIHRALRQHHSGLYERWLQAQQIGGRAHIPVGLGMHYVRSFLRVDKSQGHSSGILFLDLREAFYRVLRPLALHSHWNDEELAEIARRLNLPTGTLHELYQHLQEPCAVAQAGLPHYVQNYITAIHTDTWFQMKHQQDFVKTTIGSRPGDCYADVVFGFLWSRVLKTVEAALVSQGALEAFPVLTGLCLYDQDCQGDCHRTFLGPNWMDDLAVCVSATDSATNSDQLITKLGPIVGTLLECCCNHGMTPNLQPGKTELLLALRGRGSRKWRRHFFGPSHGQKFPALGEHASFEVHVVGAYKHLGGIIHHTGNQTREAQQRLAIAHQALTRHRKLLLHNPNLAFSKRQELFEVLVLSAFTYGMESWHFAEEKSKNMLHNGIIKLYKRFLKVPHDANLHDDQVLAQAGLPSPTELLRRARLRYLGTLYGCGQSVEWGLLFRDQYWRELVRDDMQWVWHQLRHSSSLPDPALCFPAGNTSFSTIGGTGDDLSQEESNTRSNRGRAIRGSLISTKESFMHSKNMGLWLWRRRSIRLSFKIPRSLVV